MTETSAIFIDRDGTLNEDRGYLSSVDELVIYPWAAEAVRLVNESGLKAVVITNQSGVARELCTEEEVRAIHDALIAELRRAGAHLDGIYYCPHHPEIGRPPYRMVCDCRKPRPGLLQRAAREHSIDLKRSYVVGDKWSDLELAHNVGARSALVLTGYGSMTKARLKGISRQPDFIADDLLEAVKAIIENLGTLPPAVAS
jgi:D-glycero-D-manno-heptose 1,7-bisphosphate phosphatase